MSEQVLLATPPTVVLNKECAECVECWRIGQGDLYGTSGGQVDVFLAGVAATCQDVLLRAALVDRPDLVTNGSIARRQLPHRPAVAGKTQQCHIDALTCNHRN